MSSRRYVAVIATLTEALLTRLHGDPQIAEAIVGDLLEAHHRASRERRGSDALHDLHLLLEAITCTWHALIERVTTPDPPGTATRPGNPGGRPSPPPEGFMGTLLHDFVHSARLLRRSPLFTTTAVLTLSLGIAGVVTMSALVDTILLRDLPFPDSRRLVLIGDGARTDEVGNTGFATFDDWRQRTTTLDALAMFRSWSPTLLDEGEALRLQGARMTAGGLEMLGARPALGRLFDPSEDHPDRRHVLVLSDRLWRTQFGGDPGVVGRSVDLAGTSYRIVGVLDPSFQPLLSRHYYQEAELWAPLGYRSEFPWACRSCQHLKVFGRLGESSTLQQARSEMAAIQQDLHRSHPQDYDDANLVVLPMAPTLVSAARPVLVALTAAVGAILLIACSNVASLQMARATRRRGELELRLALGADRLRLARESLMESGILWGTGAALGLVLTAILLPVVQSLTPASLLPPQGLVVDGGVLGLALALTLAATLAFGLYPALGMSQRVAGRGSKGARGAGLTARGTEVTPLGRSLLVVGNVALAFAVLAGAGLMLESIDHLLSVDPGLRTEDVLTGKLSLLGSRYEEDVAAVAAQEALLEAVGSLPGVEGVALASQVPFTGDYDGRGVDVEGEEAGEVGGEAVLQRYSVTHDYFRLFEIPLVRGRLFGPQDRNPDASVALVSESAVHRIAPDGDVLGRRIQFGGRDFWTTIVGVVGDVRHHGLSSEVQPAVYLSQNQWTDRYLTMALRTAVPHETLVEPLRHTVAETSPGVPVYDVASLEALALDTASRQRFTTTVLTTFSLVALFLASVGLYGVVAFVVERRTREIGVRVALGALRGRIAGLVLGQGAILVGSGLVLGALLAFASNRLLEALLYGVVATDPGTHARAVVLLLLVALLAHLAPLLRALRVSPASVLRED